MPSHTTMYNQKGEAIYQFGEAHRNTISWSPHGRFLCVSGFGNLAGEMDFYDTAKMKKIGKYITLTIYTSTIYNNTITLYIL